MMQQKVLEQESEDWVLALTEPLTCFVTLGNPISLFLSCKMSWSTRSSLRIQESFLSELQLVLSTDLRTLLSRCCCPLLVYTTNKVAFSLQPWQTIYRQRAMGSLKTFNNGLGPTLYIQGAHSLVREHRHTDYYRILQKLPAQRQINDLSLAVKIYDILLEEIN